MVKIILKRPLKSQNKFPDNTIHETIQYDIQNKKNNNPVYNIYLLTIL